MRSSAAAFAVVLVVAVAGCGGAARPRSPSRLPSAASIRVTSSFGPGGAIPRLYTCDGRDVSPPLGAAGIPSGAVELIVVMRDRDALGGNFIHWALAHVKPGSGSLHASFAHLPVGQIPAGAILGRNSFGSLGYRGPCPPPGATAHHYEITVYALGRPSQLHTGFTSSALRRLDVLGSGTLMGAYGRR